ncbi:hypothetical protein FRC00_004876 [Tulasnella sp. 408]|nr:hypothetical protein FRC00_004876 [Tulasnella sp. 408]
MQNNEHNPADNIAPDSKDDTRDQVGKSSSGNAQPNDRITKLKVDSELRDAEANSHQTKHKGEEGAEGQERRSDGERQRESAAVNKMGPKAPGVYTDIGDRKGEANASMIRANTHLSQCEYKQAFKLYSECLLVYTKIGDKKGRAGALWGLAKVHRRRYKYSQAYALYSECLQIWTDIGNRLGRAKALRVLASVHILRKEYSQAIAFCTEGLQIWTDTGDKLGRADALRTLAKIHQLREEYTQAFQLYSESLQISTDIGYTKRRASALRGLAVVHWLRGEYTQAVPLYSECLAIYNDLGDRKGVSTTSWDLAMMHLFHGNFRQAMALFPTPLKHGSINHFYEIQSWRASRACIETKATTIAQPTIRDNLQKFSKKLDSQWLQFTRRSILGTSAGVFKVKRAA